MRLPGQGLCTALLVILAFFNHPGVNATTHSSKIIRHLFDITDSKVGPLVLPTDVEVHQSRIYVVDSGNNRVVVLNKNGKTQFSFGREGAGEGEFQDPVGLAVDHDGLIYVADTGNHRIQIFTANGEYSGTIAVTFRGEAVRPIDVAVDPKAHNIFVTGNENHRVMVFDRSGRMLREWGGNGTKIGQFRYPATIAVTRNFDIAVVDVFNTRVQLFQPDGIFLVAIGEWGVLPGQLFRPKGIAVGNEGYLYVSDSYMNVIQVFNDSGQLLHVLKMQDTRHEMVTPAGIAVAANNRLYVAEMLEHRISVYQID
jgi:DNA-binding beta-propeller fold protein YncE